MYAHISTSPHNKEAPKSHNGMSAYLRYVPSFVLTSANIVDGETF